MPTTSTRRRYRRITKAAFDRLSIHGKRVALAKDLLERLHLGKLVAYAGSLIRLPTEAGWSSPADCQRALNRPRAECAVCAKGAVLATWVGLFDGMSAGAIHRSSQSHLTGFPSELVEVFGQRLMSALEIAFEQAYYDSWNGTYVTDSEASALIAAFKGEDDINARLRALYRHLVKRGGQLVIKDANGSTLVFD